jgi:hypothetical protein
MVGAVRLYLLSSARRGGVWNDANAAACSSDKNSTGTRGFHQV